MDDRIENISKIVKEQQANKLQSVRHNDQIVSNLQLQETVVQSFKTLVDYLDKKTTKTVVLNQLQEIGTPDAFKVVEAIKILDETIRQQPFEATRDVLADISETMKSGIAEMQKSLQTVAEKDIEIPEQKFVDYSERFSAMEEAVNAVTEAVKAQKLIAEAPQVNVEAPQVNVEKPDLKPLEKHLQAVEKAVRGIVIPKTDFKDVLDQLKKANETLRDLAEHPASGGGGGGASFPETQQIANKSYAVRIVADSGDASVSYIGKAEVGSTTSSSVWQIREVDKSGDDAIFTWADGNDSFDNTWDDRESLTYL